MEFNDSFLTSLRHDGKSNLHDCLALGAFEYGLPYLKIRTVEANSVTSTVNSEGSTLVDSGLKKVSIVTEDNVVHTEIPSEIHRLPLLLRILSQSRPLSSIPSLRDFLLLPKDDTSILESTPTNDDPLLDDIVARLEDRAAIYAASERVQMVSCHLAPAACHQLSKLPPLSRRKSRPHSTPSDSTPYDTTQLDFIAQNLLQSSDSGTKKQRRLSLTNQTSANSKGDFEEHESGKEGGDDVLRGRQTDELDDSDCDSEAEATVVANMEIKKRKRTRPGTKTRALSINNASEDSPEYNVLKVLHELISLTISSLEKGDENEKMIDKEDSKNERTSIGQSNEVTFRRGGSLALPKLDDSILAQPLHRGKSVANSSSSDNAMIKSSPADLASTVVALMHHAPVLQHRHVASALCRAALPQTPVMISRMGANCPAGVPCLLDGCIAVYCRAIAESSIVSSNQMNAGAVASSISHLSNIASACVESVRLLAKLSPREGHRAISTLRRRNVMFELQLELMMQHDALAAVMFLNQQLSVDAAIASSATEVGPLVQPTTTLSYHLQQNVSLLRDVLHFINSHLSAQFVPSAKHSMILASYVRILSGVSMISLFATDGIEILLRILASLKGKLEMLREDVARNLQQSEELYNLFTAALVSTCAVLLSDDRFQESNIASQLKNVIDIDVAPQRSRVMLIRLSLSILYVDEHSLYELVDSSIDLFKVNPRNATSMTSQRNERFRSLLKTFCTSAVSLSVLNQGCEDCECTICVAGNASLLYPSVALQLLNYKQSAHIPVTNLLERVLKDSEAILLFLQDPLAVEFVENGVSAGLCQEGAKLPIVTPVQIQSLASSLLLSQWELLEIPVLQFLMQLLYCFYFFEQLPCSPFRIDPRTLPLNRILEQGERHEPSRRIHPAVLVKLAYFIDKYCPEVRRFHRFKMLKSQELLLQRYRSKLFIKNNKQEFTRIIREAVASTAQCEGPGGDLVEEAFMEASLSLSDADIISVCVSVLVSSPSSLPLYFTYPMLYRDPLVVLKCPLTVWNCRGTRRVLLFVLSNLLVTNEFVARRDAACQEAADELLSSRNEIVLRCLLHVMTSSSSRLKGSTLVCLQTCSLVRRLVACNEGLTALLIKQGLSMKEMEWLTETVPEVALDLSTIQGMLTEKTSLSAAKRLTVADCCVRIAIAHGHRSDDNAAAIVHSCLSQLLSSFFLILGPIGVPVNALVGQGSDLDATQVARKAAVHLLSSLQKIQPFRTSLKVETLSILQKLLGMCKGESIIGTFQTSITASQKSLLKDLVDIIKKAIESMGLARNTPD